MCAFTVDCDTSNSRPTVFCVEFMFVVAKRSIVHNGNRWPVFLPIVSCCTALHCLIGYTSCQQAVSTAV